MSNTSHTPPLELLAPARTADIGISAIDCGADAVYIGAERFGARAAAANAIQDIARLCDYAHRFWARVYVTVNTLLRDDELPLAADLILTLYQIGVDGIIIQDVGLLECNLPPVPLIASTQMHIASPEKATFLEHTGFSRLTLARELSLDEIRAIRRSVSVPLECFVHGALCVCYSGQCYLSVALGGRSGNRGECAQPCRKPYSLEDDAGHVIVRGKHLLSIKDLNLTEHLDALVDSGVSAFKIEGRLKDAAYVRNITAWYRSQLDEVIRAKRLRRPSSGMSLFGFTPKPDKTFNRGYSAYFIDSTRRLVGSMDSPKSLGERIGVVTAVQPGSFTLDTSMPLHNGDGICFLDGTAGLRGTSVNTVHGARVQPEKMTGIKPGTVIMRNHDHAFERLLDRCVSTRTIPVSIAFEETATGFALCATDEDGVAARRETECHAARAPNPAAAAARIAQQAAKCGGTEFSCLRVDSGRTTATLIPAAVLNAARRDLLAALRAARQQQRPIEHRAVTPHTAPYPEPKLDYRGNILNKRAAAFYRRHGVREIQPAVESGVPMTGKTVMTTRFCLRHELGQCPCNAARVRAAKPWFLMDEDGSRLKLEFECGRCLMHVVFCAAP